MIKNLLWLCAVWLCMVCNSCTQSDSGIFGTYYNPGRTDIPVAWYLIEPCEDDSIMVWVYSGANVAAGKDYIIAQEKMMLTDSAGTGVFYLTNGEGTIRVHEGKMGALGFSKGKQIANRHRLIETYKQRLMDDYNRMVEKERQRQEEERRRIEQHPIEVVFSELRFVKAGLRVELVLKAMLRNLSDKTFIGAEFWEEYDTGKTTLFGNDPITEKRFMTSATLEFNKEYVLDRPETREYNIVNGKIPKVSYDYPWKPQETIGLNVTLEENNWWNNESYLTPGFAAYVPKSAVLNMRFTVEDLDGRKTTIQEHYTLMDVWKDFMEKSND